MGYLGVPPQSGFITTAKQRVTGSTNNYVDLDHAISNLSNVIVWVNFVKQDSTNLTLTTSTRITLGATLVASDIVEIAYLGKAVATQTPDTGTVTNDMLAGSIANSKLANSSITLNGSAVSLGGSATISSETNTPAFFVYRSSQQSGFGNETPTKIQFNAEKFDTDNAFDSSTNYRFTVPSGKAGKYFFSATARAANFTGTGMRLSFYVNGTAKGHHAVSIADGTESGGQGYHSITNTFSLNLSVSDYVEMYLWQKSGASRSIHGDSSDYGLTHFSGFRITA